MKKLQTILLAIVAIICATTTSIHAQGSVGVEASYLSLGDWSKHLGLGLKGEYAFRERVGLVLSARYYLPKKYQYNYTAYNSTDNTSLSVDTELAYSAIHVGLDVKFYFIGDYEADFGLYGLFGGGYMSISKKYKYDISDNNYVLDDVEDDKYKNYTLGFGIGVEKKLPVGFIFVQGQANIPANEENGQQVVVEIPGSLAVHVGYRYAFN